MKTIEITQENTIEAIINSVNELFVKQNKKYVLIEFQYGISRSECEKIIETIKKYFDILVILKTGIPERISQVEEYFSYGVHGVYFSDYFNGNASQQLKKIEYATKIFPEGLIFAKAGDNRHLVEEMLNKSIIPVVSECNNELVEFIKSHKGFSQYHSKYLKYIPVLEENVCNYNLIENIKFKMQLEALNLRKKLMVKNVEDSFNSSGL